MNYEGGAPGPPCHSEGPGPPGQAAAAGHEVLERPDSRNTGDTIEFGFCAEDGGRAVSSRCEFVVDATGGGGGEDLAGCLQFLCLDENEEYGLLSEADRRILLSIQQGDADLSRHQYSNSQCSPEESLDIEFGCASEVFNSITTGQFRPGPEPTSHPLIGVPSTAAAAPSAVGANQLYMHPPPYHLHNSGHNVAPLSCQSSLAASPILGQQYGVLAPGPAGQHTQPGMYSAVVPLCPGDSQQQAMAAASQRLASSVVSQQLIYPAHSYPLTAQQIYYTPPTQQTIDQQTIVSNQRYIKDSSMSTSALLNSGPAVQQAPSHHAVRSEESATSTENLQTSSRPTQAPQQVSGFIQQLPGAPQQLQGTQHQHPGVSQHLGAPQQLPGASQNAGVPQQHPGAGHQLSGVPQQNSGIPQQPRALQQLQGAPQQQSDAPIQQQGAPQQHPGAPHQPPDSPQKIPGAPQQHFGAPQHSGAPQKHPEDQQINQGNPQHPGAFQQLQNTLQQHSGAPQQHQRAPQQYQGAPPQHPGAPRQHPGAPQQHSGAPQQQPGAPQQQPVVSQHQPGVSQHQPGVPQQQPVVSQHQPGVPHHSPQQAHPGAPPQHIHINHFTANLTYLPAVSNASSAQPSSAASPTTGLTTRQPVPFATYPLNYVAPFPQSSAASPPMFSSTPFPPPMVIYPPGHSVHFSMYTPPPSVPAASASSRPDSRGQGAQRSDSAEGLAGPPVVSVKTLVEDEDMDESRDDYDSDHVNNDADRGHSSRATSPTPESQSDESQQQQNPGTGQPLDHHQKCSDEPELTKLYDNITSGGTSESGGPSATPRQRQMEGSAMHQPTPPPFPITSDASDTESGGHQARSWASLLFSSSDPGVERIHVDKPTARIPPFSTVVEGTPPTGAGLGSGVLSTEQISLGRYLKTYEHNHAAASILPRGLTNRSNWCFVNSILQALLACPPFYNLFKSLPNLIGLTAGGGKSGTPMLDAVVEFVNEFKPLEMLVNKNLKKDKGRKWEDVTVDITFEPSYVYTVLLESKSLSFNEGRQEDAEEFLTFLLNKLDEEMRSLIKVTQTKEASELSSDQQVGEWHETKGKSCVTRRVVDSTTATRTPIQSLFVGLTRSSVIAENCETSATLQPFVTLQLDIQSPDDLDNLQDVLLNNFASRPLEGYRNPRSGQLARASQTLSLEELSPVLILHLKRMVHDGRTEQKVMKEIQFPVDLVITSDILSASCKTKYTKKQRQYKLFAVVYHNGKEAIKGHYVTDIYHTGYSCWLRCNDNTVSVISEEEVTSPLHHSTPYILLYRQRDTMGGGAATAATTAAADRNKTVPGL